MRRTGNLRPPRGDVAPVVEYSPTSFQLCEVKAAVSGAVTTVQEQVYHTDVANIYVGSDELKRH
uniref:Uncharacterized protein n=1 Tax=Hyaloperonospora arabidopsidis (strain Emoy2) TaxID=559515 RepID=M4BSA7_HYAAE